MINIGSGTITESLSKTLIVGLTGTVKTFGPLTVTIVSDKIFSRSYTANDGRGPQSISGSTSFTVVIPSNQNSVSVTILTFNDGNVGNNVFSLTGSVSATGFTVNSGVLTVLDIDAGGFSGTGSLTLTISSGTVSETLSKSLSVSLPSGINTNMALTITLGYSPTFPAGVGGSYSIPANVVIQSGQNSATFVVTTAQDCNVGNNAFSITGTVTLPNYVINAGSLTVTDITGNDPNNKVINITSGVVTETLSKILTVSLTGTVGTNSALTVTLISVPSFPLGYGISNSVVIPAGGHSVSFTITTVDDKQIGNLSFSLSATAIGYTVNPGILSVSDTTKNGTSSDPEPPNGPIANNTVVIYSGSVSESLSRMLTVGLPQGISTTTGITVTITPIPVFPAGYTVNGFAASNTFKVFIPANSNWVTYSLSTADDSQLNNLRISLSGTVSSSDYVVRAGTLGVSNTTGSGGSVDPENPPNLIPANTVVILSGSITEGLSRTFSVSLPQGITTASPLTVSITPIPAFPAGYQVNNVAVSGSFDVLIPSGSQSTTYALSTVDDRRIGNLTFSLSGTVTSTYVVRAGTLSVSDTTGGGGSSTDTRNPPSQIANNTILIYSGSITESSTGTLTVSLPQGISTSSAVTLTVNVSPAFPAGYTVNGIGATSSFPVFLPSNTNSVTYSLGTVRDGNVGDNLFTLSGTSSSSDYVVSGGSLTVTDVDVRGGMNGTGSTTLTISSGVVNEGSSRVLNVSLPVTINVTTTPLTVTIYVDTPFLAGYTINGNSVSGSTSFTVVIPGGQHQGNYTIQTASDGNIPDNIFYLRACLNFIQQ